MGNDERAKLRTILDWWLEHNKEHSQGLREWAEKAKAFGEAEAGEEMLAAVQQMDKVNDPYPGP